ncbi:GDA1/CD39 family protein [Teladorsagia circumcincta]|uniref:GDA1/CD39 family protein n=1 Tax=Teladorsagia circumcincta TaxID=45464 RepID=A0A2G9UMJ0_TELCI|nr:GDA1/CD39 family protein [Teladorsagia circumcincta]
MLSEDIWVRDKEIGAQGVPCRFFAIVFDAGSTGTRLHLYKYVHNTDRNGIPFKVEEEIFREAKPALSSFIDDPSAAGSSIRGLLETAQAHVPLFMWEKTPITLKATAGLRLLPGDLADDILDAVEDVIADSGFFVVPDAVSIMSGSDEGMYSWFTLNLLLNSLYSALRGKTIYLFSYFFDRGFNAGLVKEHHGGLVKLEDFKVAAQRACSRGPEELKGFHWMPWQCHDLSYIYSLLHDGYGFHDNQPLFVSYFI